MNFTKTIGILLVSLAVMSTTGCRTAPIRQVENQPTGVAYNVSLDAMQGAIIRAGTGLGWIMKPIEPGLIEGTLLIRSHMAKVDIPYDRNSFSIHYKDSDNLFYDGTNIHSNYNGWIENLERAIRLQLSTL